MNGTKVAEGTLPKIVPLQTWIGEAVEMGEDGGSAVHFTYTLPFKFTGAPSHRTRKAVDEESEAEERADLAVDEVGQPHPVGAQTVRRARPRCSCTTPWGIVSATARGT